jgi:hypothetical protein
VPPRDGGWKAGAMGAEKAPGLRSFTIREKEGIDRTNEAAFLGREEGEDDHQDDFETDAKVGSTLRSLEHYFCPESNGQRSSQRRGVIGQAFSSRSRILIELGLVLEADFSAFTPRSGLRSRPVAKAPELPPVETTRMTESTVALGVPGHRRGRICNWCPCGWVVIFDCPNRNGNASCGEPR